MKTERNEGLYNYIVDNRIKALFPMTYEEIAKNTGYSTSHVREFAYIHNLSNIEVNDPFGDIIITLYNGGFKLTEIGKIFGMSPQRIAYKINSKEVSNDE